MTDSIGKFTIDEIKEYDVGLTADEKINVQKVAIAFYIAVFVAN